jgi:rhodanese-related sulfurtransferase
MQAMLKRAVYAVNGMSGTELNPNFLSQVTALIPDKATPIAVMCNSGGTVEASSTAGMEGKKSRSLISIYRLMVELGYTDVAHVEGGMREWAGLGWPVEGTDIESWKAKAAMMP